MSVQITQGAASPLRMLRIDDGEHYEIDDDSFLPFRHIQNLGSGGSGIVEKIVHIETNSVYARKTFQVPPGEWDRVKQLFRREVEITRRLARHRHVVRLVASYSTPWAPTVILEPAADGGTLKDFLARFVSVHNKTVKASMQGILQRAFGCLANGLAFIHQHEIRHRDIKPENILIHAGFVLFTDFGISRDYSDRTRATTEGKPDSYTPRYCAPEVRFWERRTWKSDVFSLGCVFLLLYTALWPNKEVEVIVTTSWFHAHLEELAIIMKSFTRDLKVVVCMVGMLSEEEKHRPSAAEVIQLLKGSKSRYFCELCAGELRKWVTVGANPILMAYCSAKQPPRRRSGPGIYQS
jgi:serine/threonine protein kinase